MSNHGIVAPSMGHQDINNWVVPLHNEAHLSNRLQLLYFFHAHRKSSAGSVTALKKNEMAVSKAR